MSTTENYSEYTVSVSDEPSYYGSEVTSEQAVEIADRIGKMIEGQFPEIEVVRHSDGGISAATKGPDDDVIFEIDNWVSENWTKAL